MFSVFEFIRKIYAVAENVPILTAWHAESREDPDILRDIRDGVLYRKRFLRHFGDSKFNICVSIAADGVQKSGLTEKTVLPVMLRVESVGVNAKTDKNLQHMVALCPGNYRDLNQYLGRLSAELRHLGSDGIDVQVAGVGVRKVRVATVLLGGDLRAIQSLAGKYRDPALQFACPNCDLPGFNFVAFLLLHEHFITR